MRPGRARAGVVVVVAVEVLVLGVILPAARSRPIPTGALRPWLDNTPPGQVLGTVALWLALATGLWLLAATTLALASTLRPTSRWARVTRRWTPRVLRRLCAAAAAPVLVTGPLPLATAIEAPIPPPAEQPTPSSEEPSREPPGPADEAPSDPSPTIRTPGSQPSASPAVTVVVEPGDNLWVLTARQIAAERGIACTDVPVADVAERWRDVVRENHDRLRSGDPDLIFPGESVVIAAG